ncbi:unnamed protein product [Ophioblennius macclurei]
MKCYRLASPVKKGVDKVSTAAESKMQQLKESPVKDPVRIKPQYHHADPITDLSSLESIDSPVNDKENMTGSEQNDCVFEDSGYLSQQSSQVLATDDSSHLLESAGNSPSHGGINPVFPASLTAPFTPVLGFRRTAALSSTPSYQHDDTKLPILKFEQAVCEELAKGFQKNKKYDWTVVSKVAEDHLLDRVIGRQIGLEYVDVFESLLARNMRVILTNILAQLGDMDLISCKKVSRTWWKIISEDKMALSRCQKAEESLRESRSSLKRRNLTDASRVVLSCMQNLPSSSSSSIITPSSSSTSVSRISRVSAPAQKCVTSTSRNLHFNKYVEAAQNLKNHESLRPCRRCASPAVHTPEAHRATCTRPDCLFTFCTRCQEADHGSSPCRTVAPRDHMFASKINPNIPGSARSKRNIRRL